VAGARRYFERARMAGAGRQAGVYVAMAESTAVTAGDRVTHEKLLREAMAVAQAHPGLSNRVMQERAAWLLDTIDDRY
jgi:hypothetical protein